MVYSNNSSKSKWQGHTGGGNFGQKALVLMLRIVPLRLIYCLMAFVVPFYIVFANKRYRAIYRYFRKHFSYSPLKAFAKTCRNHFIFGQIVIDRFAIFAGKRDVFDIEIDNYDCFDRLNKGKEAFIIASAHIGNYEIAGYMLKSHNKPFNTLVYASETLTVSQNRVEMMKDNNINLIPIRDDISHMMAASMALQNGEILSAVVDRTNGTSKSVECRFLNGKADFPIGVFMLAATFEVEMIAVFSVKVSYNRYKIFIKHLTPDLPPTLSKRQKAEQLIHSYIAHTEGILKLFPEQWFNFYDFWKN